jgi:opacity protein-like surface antigen
MKKSTSFAFAFFIAILFSHQKLCAADAGQFYAGMDIGSIGLKGDGPKNDPAFVAGQRFKASDYVYGLHAGFQFIEWFAAEFGVTDFGNTSDHFAIKDGIFFLVQPNDTQQVDAKGASLIGAFSYPVSSRLSLLGIVGIASVDFDIKQSGGSSPLAGSLSEQRSFSEQGLLYGFGAKYALEESLDVRAEVRRNEVGDFMLDAVSLGVEYGF